MEEEVVHYFSEDTGRLKKKVIVIRHIFYGREYIFISSPGVFSKDKIDRGTELLIKNLMLDNIPKNGKILDLGCGYGPIGIVAASIRRDCKVWMVDINKRAVWLAKVNAYLNGVYNNTVIVCTDMFNVLGSKKFHAIFSNPPISRGKKFIERMLRACYSSLYPKGYLQIVARHNKGGRWIANKMEEIFGTVHISSGKGGFRVYTSVKGEENGRGEG